MARVKTAILLCAGLGSRLGSISKDTPKCLVPIGETNVLDIWLNKLNAAGIEKILINTHHHADQVEDFVLRHQFREKIETFYEPQLLGTAGTLFSLREKINDCFFFIHTDNYSSVDLKEMVKSWEKVEEDYLGMALTFTVENPLGCGIFEVNYSNQTFLSFKEKPADTSSYIANGAMFILSEKLFEIHKCFSQDFDFCRDVLPNVYQLLKPFHLEDFHIDIGTPKNLERARSIQKYAQGLSQEL